MNLLDMFKAMSGFALFLTSFRHLALSAVLKNGVKNEDE